MNVVVLFTYENGKYYIEAVDLRDIEEVKKCWGDKIFQIIDCTDTNWKNFSLVSEELYRPTAETNGQMFAVIESVFDESTLKEETSKEKTKSQQNVKDIFKYNTKNAGQQLLDLINDFYKDIDAVSKFDMLEEIRGIGVELIKQYEEHKDKF